MSLEDVLPFDELRIKREGEKDNQQCTGRGKAPEGLTKVDKDLARRREEIDRVEPGLLRWGKILAEETTTDERRQAFKSKDVGGGLRGPRRRGVSSRA
jgi:hypothetical protein